MVGVGGGILCELATGPLCPGGHFPHEWGKPFCPAPPGIPCELASLVRVPLRFAKGRKTACSAFLWMDVPSAEAPASAGMTVGGVEVTVGVVSLRYWDGFGFADDFFGVY